MAPRGIPVSTQQLTNGVQVSKVPLQNIGVPPSHTSIEKNIDSIDDDSFIPADAPNDMSVFGSILTPNSNSDDINFQYMLDFGWESLDTIGASMRDSEGAFGVGI